MDASRLNELLEGFPDATIAVVGDFFLDKYLEIDPALAETSLETRLNAHQIKNVRCYPGAAGTVVNNLVALGVGQIKLIGYVGCDGQGFDLQKGLMRPGVNLDDLIETPERMTPTYVKPLICEADQAPRELERLDIKNRTETPEEIEDDIIKRLADAMELCQGVIVADQVQEADCGVITERVRNEIARLGDSFPECALLADSRCRIGEFRSVIVKPNHSEGARSLGMELDQTSAEHMVRHLAHRTGRPACLTLGARGLLAFNGQDVIHIPGFAVDGPVDIVGAGDSMTAGIVSSLCAGATLGEAALVGNLTASITVQQIGMTGTATPDQLRERFAEYHERHPKVCNRV